MPAPDISPGAKIVRTTIRTGAVLAAVAIVGGISTLNYRFASKLSSDPVDQVIYGAMAVAIVIIGTIIWLMVEAAWKKSRKTAYALSAAGLVFAGWALTMSAGHIGSNRIMANKGSHYAEDRSVALKKDEANLQTQLVSLGTYRDAGRLEADLKIMRDSFSWVQTDGCKTQKTSGHKKFCKGYADREGELSTAKKAQAINNELRIVQTKIESIGAGTIGDGQSRVLGGLINASLANNEQAEEAVSRWLALAQAIVSLFAELTVVRIIIMLFGWRPEELVGRSALTEAIEQALATNTQIIDRTITRYRDPVTGVLRTGAAA